MKITREEMEVLRKYIPDVDAIVKSGDVSEFELTLDLSLIHIYSGSGGGKSSGSSKANKDDGSAMIGDLSEDNLQDIALNIYLGTGKMCIRDRFTRIWKATTAFRVASSYVPGVYAPSVR